LFIFGGMHDNYPARELILESVRSENPESDSGPHSDVRFRGENLVSAPTNYGPINTTGTHRVKTEARRRRRKFWDVIFKVSYMFSAKISRR